MFGDKIKTLRQSYNLSQVQLADQLNVSKFFSVSTDYLLELEERKFIEVTGLTRNQLAHIQQIINDILEKTK